MSWPKVKLGDICRIEIGKTPPRAKSEYWGIGYPFLSIKDMNQGKFMVETKEEITDAALQQSNYRLVPKGTLLMSFKLSIGKLGITKVDMYTNEAIAALYVDESRVYKEYLYHALQSIDLLATTDRAVMGATLNKRKLALIPVPLPPLDEQKRIATILNKANEIEGAAHLAQKMRSELITATFLDMFGDPIVNPNNFNKVKLESVTKFHKQGLYFNQGYSKSGNQLIRIADMRKDGSLNFGTMPFIEIDSKTQKQFSVEVGDFLFARSGSIGTCAIVREDTDAVFGSFIIKFQFTEELLNDYFIHYYQLPQIEMMIRSMSHGSTNTNINAKNIKNLDVMLPPIALQKKFLQIVNTIKQMPNSTELSYTNLASLSQEILL